VSFGWPVGPREACRLENLRYSRLENLRYGRHRECREIMSKIMFMSKIEA
jgi:hypothetical protein